MTPEWIATERRKIETEKENAIGMANQSVGALRMLAALEALMATAATLGQTGGAPTDETVSHPAEE